MGFQIKGYQFLRKVMAFFGYQMKRINGIKTVILISLTTPCEHATNFWEG